MSASNLAALHLNANAMQHGLLSNGCAAQLLRWLVEQPQLQPRWANRLALRYGSFWFEHLLKSQNDLYHVPAADPPHFVMGFWRSGTTLLHNRIYAASHSRSPVSWECFNPSSFRLRRPPTTDVMVKRPMDEGQISTFGPQEDEFALMLLGEPSLYRAFLHPSRFLELIDEAKSSADADYPRWCQFLSLAQRDECRPLILKSPNHWLRLPMIARTFPAAKQVWVGRDFAKTYLSNINMWTEMARIHALSEWSSTHIADAIFKLAVAYRNRLDLLVVNRTTKLLWIDFTQLMADPSGQTEHAIQFLDLAPLNPDERGAVSADTVARSHAQASLHAASLPTKIQTLVAEINDLHAQAQRRWGAQ